MEPYVGQIMIFAGQFAPRGWALCNGQLLPIGQYEALHAIIGTTYGGDGQTTFALPDLRGRVPVHYGAGSSLKTVGIGEKGGSDSIRLTEDQLPLHNHLATITTGPDKSLTDVSSGNWLAHEARFGENALPIYTSETGTSTMATGSVTVQPTGKGSPVDVRPPYLGVNFIIATTGIFPSEQTKANNENNSAD